MIDRRSFLSTLGASAVLVGAPVFSNQSVATVTGSRTRVALNGEWEHHIDGVLYDKVTVPSSRRPSGYYCLNRSVILPRLAPGQRALVHFEAITYWGRVTLNGKPLGTMGPYVPYTFEFSPEAKEGKNELQVEIADLVPLPDGSGRAELALGVNPGWEAYGGIIRDVWAEIRPASFVENVRLAYQLSDDYGSCSASPSVTVSSAETTSGSLELVLKHAGVEVARARKTVQLKSGANEFELTFVLKNPVLWSPEAPNLYELTVDLHTSSGEDSWSCKTGFRDIRTQGRQFLLNGKKLVLNGVCRHDMWREQGFTLSPLQQEQDMGMIKSLGCNFVRLVHYPHDRRIIELADQLGLLVSEEPGFWGMDFNTMERSRIDVGYNILDRLIRRDWNSPSVMAWLLSNECTLTEKFLKEGKERCNQLDPIKRLVSAANDKDAKKVKAVFVGADMDFFDQHPYTDDVEDFAREAEFDGPSKPLTFTEWGGKAVGQSDTMMRKSVDRLIDLVESGELSGHMFWSWQDMRQYSRIDGEMRDGVLESGIVTEAREPRDVVWMELTRLFDLRRHAIEPLVSSVGQQPRATVLRLRSLPFAPGSTFQTTDLQPLVDSVPGRQSWAALEAALAMFWAGSVADKQWQLTGSHFGLWPGQELGIAGVPFRSPVVENRVRPVVLTVKTPEITIPINQACSKLHILGQVTFPLGYPLSGGRGETVAIYKLQYASGKTQRLPVRNGIEVAQSNRIHTSTRIDPIAVAAQPAVEYIKDIVREQYQILLWSVPTRREKLVSLRCSLNGPQAPLAIFAITSEQSQVDQ
jgi:hypothetical protein